MPILVMYVDVTTTRTARTDRFGLLQKPDTNLEAKILAGQGANRTDIDSVSSVRIIELFARKGGNLCRVTTLKKAELVGLRDLVAETHTACAHATAVRVKDHITTKVHDLAPTHFLSLKAAMIEAILQRILGQPPYPVV